MKPRTVCRCQPMVSMISEIVAPPLRRSMATTWAVLLPSRGAASSRAFAAVLPLGAALAAVAFLAALAFAGAPLADCAPRLAACAPPLAFRSAFGSGVLADVAAGLLAGVPAFGGTRPPHHPAAPPRPPRRP